ncbi:MAG: glycosyltransferase family 2 protein [bacterium]
MKVTGFSFVRNALKYNYPVLESYTSILPVCDEFIVVVGKSEDATLDLIQSINSPKIKIIETVWDESLRSGGLILSQQTNVALHAISADWAFYIQADEVVHENDLPAIRTAMEEYLPEKKVEGLLFSYNHFFGSYEYIGSSRRWYRKEIRVVRPGIGVSSWKDAQGFRIADRKVRVKEIDATIFHYGWVKPPQAQQAKQKSFNKLWHSDDWIDHNVGSGEEYEYQGRSALTRFSGSHPAVMKKQIADQNWKFEYDPAAIHRRMKDGVLEWIESNTGWRIGEYKNYELIE